METVLKPFVSRFAQPVILSFCIAWIFWNWEIVVGLIWYNATTLPNYGYKNYKDLINGNAIWQRNYLYPLVIAVAYPYLRFGLNYFNTQLKTEERNQTLEVAGSGKMSTLRFLELRKSYEEKIAELSKYFEEQSDVMRKYNDVGTELIKVKKELLSTRESIESSNRELNSWQLALHDKELLINSIKPKLERYEDVSNFNHVVSKYLLTIHPRGKTQNKDIISAIAEITEGSELLINDSVVSMVGGYNYNILSDHFVITFPNGGNNVFEPSFFNRQMTFSSSKEDTLFTSEYILNGVFYELKLDKIRK